MNEEIVKGHGNIWSSLSDLFNTELAVKTGLPQHESSQHESQVVGIFPVAVIVLLMIFWLKHLKKNWMPWQSMNLGKIKCSRSLTQIALGPEQVK